MIAPPDVTVKSVLSPSIFSPVPNVRPMLAGITTSPDAQVRLIFLPEPIVRSVVSLEIYSPPSSPK